MPSMLRPMTVITILCGLTMSAFAQTPEPDLSTPPARQPFLPLRPPAPHGLDLSALTTTTATPAAQQAARRQTHQPVLRARYADWSFDLATLLARNRTAPDPDWRIVIDYFPDRVGTYHNFTHTPMAGGWVIRGQSVDAAATDLYVVLRDGVVSVTAHDGDHTVRILPADRGPGSLLVAEMAGPSAPRRRPPATAPGALGGASSASGAALATVTHDVLVAYTDATGTPSAVEHDIITAIATANDVYRNSRLAQRLDLVGMMRVAYEETNDAAKDLERLQTVGDGYLDAVHRRRDRLGADLVVLIVRRLPQCGRANLAVISSDADDDSAFAVVRHGTCLDKNYSLPHELGHISGAHHDLFLAARVDAEVESVRVEGSQAIVQFSVDLDADYVAAGILPTYAHGFVSSEGGWRTIMAYDRKCDWDGVPSCDRIPYFSSPRLAHPGDGRPLGNGKSDNRRRLSETATTLAGFRLRGPRVHLYEDVGQDSVCVHAIETDGHTNFRSGDNERFCDNDEAKALRLFDAPVGRVIRLYDDPSASREDDWVEIIVKRHIVDKLVPTFERSFEDADVRVIYHPDNGLDGHVSHLEVAGAPAGPIIDLYDENGGEGGIVCSLSVSGSYQTAFPRDERCDNDAARSARLYDIPGGHVIRLYDRPDGTMSDDWVEISATRDVPHYILGSFERRVERGPLRVEPRLHNGLDGKVSWLSVGSSVAGPRLLLYSQNHDRRGYMCELPVRPGRVDRLDRSAICDNDAARAAVLRDVPAGLAITVLDRKDGNREDDHTVIVTKKHVDRLVLTTFESNLRRDDVDVTYFRNNGLDGKVSRVETRRFTDLGASITLYEGNRNRQNIVCTLTLRDRTVDFKNMDACDNDEARSAMLAFARKGTVIDIFDDPDCERSDDWTRIEVLHDLTRARIFDLEKSASNARLRVRHHHLNGLNGKVSCVRIAVP